MRRGEVGQVAWGGVGGVVGLSGWGGAEWHVVGCWRGVTWRGWGASQLTGTPVIQSIAIMVLCAWRTPVSPFFWRLDDWAPCEQNRINAGIPGPEPG